MKLGKDPKIVRSGMILLVLPTKIKVPQNKVVLQMNLILRKEYLRDKQYVLVNIKLSLQRSGNRPAFSMIVKITVKRSSKMLSRSSLDSSTSKLK